MLIDGKPTAGAAIMDVINPATGLPFAKCPRANKEQLNQSVAAAKAAFPAWSALDIEERRKALISIADSLEAKGEELAPMLTAEQGKPLEESVQEISLTAMMVRVLAATELSESVLMEDESGTYLEHYTPLGVVAAITPWNMPLAMLANKIVLAMLAGNTIVAKPAPTTPLTTLQFALEANKHLPPGVFNVITDQNDLGSVLSTHPDVAKITFTGSTMTGKKVMESASNSLKRVTLELGGNDAAIVLDDMEPKEVAAKLFAGAMINCGQICLAIKRTYVPSSIYDEVCDELVRLADNMVVGDGSQPGTQMGPLQNHMQYERVLGLIESARDEGTVIAGGDVIEGPGYFVRPTIVRDLDDSARIVKEEQFGPILPVLSYDDLDDAIARANDTHYGLGGSVWTSDPKRGTEVAKKINTGMCWVNAHLVFHPAISMGGAKQSGIGRELGVEGMKEFMQRHLVYVAN
jgi:acyl-CoA reductase-like NAD-dependent aldehyde dehydrogenase